MRATTAASSVKIVGQEWRHTVMVPATTTCTIMVRDQAVHAARRAASGRRAPSEVLTLTEVAHASPVTTI